MALFDSMNSDSQQPQKNQYLTANPATDNNANTSWMSPSDSTGGGSNNVAQSQPNPPSQVSNGTMLGSIAQGNGSLPNFTSAPSQDQLRQYGQSRGVNLNDSTLNYWNPQKWGELQQRGRELQPGSDGSWYANKFLSNEEQFTGGAHQTAMNMWGMDPAEQGNNQQSNQLMQLLQQLLGGGSNNLNSGVNRGAMPYNQYAGQKLPSFGGAQPSSMIGVGNTGITGGMIGGQPMPKYDQNPGMGSNTGGYDGSGINPGGMYTGGGFATKQIDPENMSYLGGGVVDPVTGQRRNPLPGEPQ